MSRAIIVAPNLVNMAGHEYQYTSVVATALRRRGYSVQIYGSQDAVHEVLALEGFVPAFRRIEWSQGRPSRSWEILQHGRLFYEDLKQILSSAVFGKNDFIFAPTILHQEFPGWVLCLRRFSKKLPKTVLLLRYFLTLSHRSRLYGLCMPSFYRFFFWMLQRCEILPTLVSDSEELIKEYQSLTSIPIKIVPIPLEENFWEMLVRARQRIVNPNNSRHLVYLGYVHRVKGFDLLPLIIENLANNSNYEVRFTVHCGRPTEQYTDPVIADAFLRLQHLSEEGRVHLVLSNISRSAYLELLSSADVILLPCRCEYYMGQTSNTLTEAFAAGKPVVVPQDTWMARQVMETGAGTLFESGNVESLVKATEEILKDLPKYSISAQSQREKWIAFHNVDRLVDELLQA